MPSLVISNYFTTTIIILALGVSCSTDRSAIPDNYIEYDETIYALSDKDTNFYRNNFMPYYAGVTWIKRTKSKNLNVSIHNTCDNNRGNLSNHRSEIQIDVIDHDSIKSYFGKSTTLPLTMIDDKGYFVFDHIKVFNRNKYDWRLIDSLDVKIVSGRIKMYP